MKRRKSRENAFILIFESFFLNFPAEKLIDLAIKEQNLQLSDYSKELVFGVLKRREELDEKISSYLKSWDIKRISKILIAILEISFFEIIYVKDVDFPVSINEAVELAKKYFAQDGPSFVNGVLGNFVKSL